MDEADKNELIAWSKRGNILTRLTSFVGISQKQNQVSFMTSSSVHGAIVKVDHFEQFISEARMKKHTVRPFSDGSHLRLCNRDPTLTVMERAGSRLPKSAKMLITAEMSTIARK